MSKWIVTLLAVSAAAIFAGPASAIVCYTLLDKSDAVIYRGYESPVDLSMTPAGTAAREDMRRRGEYMMSSYVDDCLLVSSSRWTNTGTQAYGPASVDEIVSGMRPFAAGAPSGTPTSVSGVPGRGAPAARAAPAARSGSTGMRSGY